MPVAESLHYMLQIAAGLAHAAARGVVHRDIKPSNIIITPTGRAKLVDMGLARGLGGHADDGLTQSGVTLGTFDYISPEQALEPRDADVRSDIYSLGCAFYHVLTGRPPVPEGTAAKKLNHHQNIAPIDPRKLNPEIPDEVTAILARMMAKDPRERYQRAEHLVQHLIQVTKQLGMAAEEPNGLLFVDAALPAPPRPRPLLLAGAASARSFSSSSSSGSFPSLAWLFGDAAARRFVPGPAQNVVEPRGKAGPPPEGDATRPEPAKDVEPVEQRRREFEKDATASQVADFLQKFSDPIGQPRRADVLITLASDLDLRGNHGTEGPRTVSTLHFRGRHLLIRGKDKAHPPTIRLTDDLENTILRAALSLDCDSVEVSGLRFVVDAQRAAPTWRALPSAPATSWPTIASSSRFDPRKSWWIPCSPPSRSSSTPGRGRGGS